MDSAAGMSLRAQMPEVAETEVKLDKLCRLSAVELSGDQIRQCKEPGAPLRLFRHLGDDTLGDQTMGVYGGTVMGNLVGYRGIVKL